MDSVLHPLRIIQHYHSMPIPARKLQRFAPTLYKREHISLSRNISVVFCSDYTIRKLNARYRHIDRPTDVLSFSMGDEDLLGEIYISLQRAAIQARRYRVPYQEEVIRLFIHGFYHLLGYDHETKSDRLKMALKEDTSFQKYLSS
ncbi:MAG: rRNA maturation RNase YbeY [Chitinispirillaceae bacterium]